MAFLDELKKQVLIIDGAMGSMVQELNLPDSAYGGKEFAMLSDLLVYSRPNQLCDKIHLEYLKAGANILETNTFGASPLRLQEFDFSKMKLDDFAPLPKNLNFSKDSYEKLAWHFNFDAVKIAKKAIEKYKKLAEYDDRPLYIAGSIGPSNWMLSPTEANLNKTNIEVIEKNFFHQVCGLIDGGTDILLFETQQDPLELKAAIFGAWQAFKEKNIKLPIIALVTVDQFCKMQIFNTDITSAYATVFGCGIDVFGINCNIGPELMDKVIPKLAETSKLPICVIPNAGMPISIEGKTTYPLKPDKMAKYMLDYVQQYGINIIGGCCGTTPAHIKAISQALKGIKAPKRHVKKLNLISGPQEVFDLNERQNLILIGERLNVRGSIKIRKAVENEDDTIIFEDLEEVATEQIRDLGIKIIDVCMDSNIVETEKVLPQVIKKLTTDFQGIMCLDSFSVEALEEAIKVYPGRPIINSIALEEYNQGVSKIDAILPLTKHHNPIYIALVTDSDGPALTADKKIELAKKIVAQCAKYDVTPDQLMIDINAFPIGSESEEGMNFTLESLNCLAEIKAIHPDLMTSIGVGNLTNGLGKKPYMRKVLTSVFLDEAKKRGLDVAIVNPDHYVPVQSIEKNDYQLCKKIIFKRDMQAFAQLEEIASLKKGGVAKVKIDYNDLPLEESICQKIKDGYKQKEEGEFSKGKFTYIYKDKIALQVKDVVDLHQPLDFINNFLMKTMQQLGDDFGKGEVSLPHLLKSADVMKHCMSFIESYMKNESGINANDQIKYKGVIVLGTVYQDVHSIGKDLAKTLFENYGFKVIDLGVQVALEKFIQIAQNEQATAIGMSALLVQTSNHMITVAKMMKEANLDIPILIGGAPVNSRHASYVSMHGQNEISKINEKVFYCQSGMDGVNIINIYNDETKRPKLLEDNKAKLEKFYRIATNQKTKNEERKKSLPKRQVDLSYHQNDCSKYFTADYNLSITELKEHFDLRTLYSLNWNFGGGKSWRAKAITKEDLDQLRDKWVANSEKNGWVKPISRFGLFPAQSQGNQVIVYSQDNNTKEIGRFTFNECLGRKDKWSVAQYISNIDSGKMDVIGLQISSCGLEADKQINVFRKNGNLEECFLLQGLSDRVAEDMAEQVHQQALQAMSKEKSFGCRFSPGYPAMEDISNNKLIFDLLKAQDMGISLTDASEFHPTSTTGAFIVFHPDITY